MRKNASESPGNRVGYMKERLRELEDRNLKMIKIEEERTKIFFFNERTLRTA